MKPTIKILAAVLLGLAPMWAHAEILVDELEGTAQVQIEGERVWKRIKGSDEIRDNDVLKTGYRSKLVLRVEKNNQLVVGSNTKILINYTKKSRTKSTLSVTLFEGALFSKIVSNLDYTVYTTTASATTQLAHFSSIVEEKTGRTGFQVMSGNVIGKNLVLKGDLNLTIGSTSIVEANRPPSNPKPLTTRHVDVLSRFFGKKYIQRQIKETGVKPVIVAKKTTKRIKRSATLGRPKYKRQKLEETKLKPMFDMDYIMGRIVDDKMATERLYEKVPPPPAFTKRDHIIGAGMKMVRHDGGSYPYWNIRTGIQWKDFKLMLRFPFVPPEEGGIGMGEWSSADAILEKIAMAEWIPEKLPFYFTLGDLPPITLGYGLSTEKFQYYLPSAAVQKTGLQFGMLVKDVQVEVFTPSVLSWDLIGQTFIYDSGLFMFLIAYLIDLDQNAGLHPGDYAFLNRDYVFPSEPTRAVHLYDLQAAWNIYYHPPAWLQLHAGFSQILEADSGSVGYGAILPGFTLTYYSWRLLLELRATKGKFVAPYYHPFTGEERASYGTGNTANVVQSRMNDAPSTKAVRVGIGKNVLKGSSISITYTQNVLAEDTTGRITPPKDATTQFRFSLSEQALAVFRNLDFYFEQYHGDYFNYGYFEMSPLTRLGVDAGMLLRRKWEIELGFGMRFRDTRGNGLPDDVESIVEFGGAIARHF